MLRLRPYKKCDAGTVVSWLKDETTFRMWSADRYDHYPITAEDLNAHYEGFAYSDHFYEMTAFDETGVVGHMILRFTDPEKKSVRFGFVSVDDAKRGKGYGKQMLRLAIRYAFDILRAERITLGVFEGNESAFRCYRALGFRETGELESCMISGKEWIFREMELPGPEAETPA